MSIVISPLLRKALIADAFLSGVAALLLVAGGAVLGPVMALPAGLLAGAGLLLVPYAGALVLAARRDVLPRALVLGVVMLNAVWVVASLLLLVAGPVAPNALGIAFVLLQALAVAVFAEMQAIGLRRSAPAVA
ncbi:hypothetical protein [Arenibaculum pallidiluteum]|uniref:hypothetical protein n=1 Tax=Arenibaculum pallidiluteum TaxID=2812559 RepID=UPI001F201EF8|nr:hypothetical protein [Arenibaculum pallidiluteum]